MACELCLVDIQLQRMAVRHAGFRPPLGPDLILSGLIRVIEHGSVSARTGRAICNALLQQNSITRLQVMQDAGNERLWKFAAERIIVRLILTGMLTTAIMHKHAAKLLVDRDLESAVAALDDHRLLDSSTGAARDGTLQALFNHAVAGSWRPTAPKTARVLCFRHNSIDPSAFDNKAFIVFCGYGDLSMVRRLLTDARVDPAAQERQALCDACNNGHIGIVGLLLADARIDPCAHATLHSSKRARVATST